MPGRSMPCLRSHKTEWVPGPFPTSGITSVLGTGTLGPSSGWEKRFACLCAAPQGRQLLGQFFTLQILRVDLTAVPDDVPYDPGAHVRLFKWLLNLS